MDFTKDEKTVVKTLVEIDIDRLKHGYFSPQNQDIVERRRGICESILAKLEEKDEPITANWLESVGAIIDESRFSSLHESWIIDIIADYSLSLRFQAHPAGFVNSFLVVRGQWTQLRTLTRRQLAGLYCDLSGKELGDG